VELVAAGPVKQRRLTVAFRLILAIPHGFVLFFLDLAGLVVAFLGWWGALFIGRLPAFAVTYLSGLARWNARFYGYLYLLTDDYPPFTFDDDPAYPIVIAIPPAGRLNRFAVFFRFILIIWAYIVVTVVTAGASVIAIIGWLITLITGKLPAPLHLAFTAVLRFQTRYNCYDGLLTSAYPWKLFGDEPGASAPVTAAPAEPTAPAEPAWGTPPAAETTPGYATAASVYGTPGGWGSAPPAIQPASWRLVLPRSAKNLLILFIVLGAIIEVGGQVARIAISNRTTNQINVQATAVSQWNSAFNTLKTNLGKDSTTACGQNLGCITKADSLAATYFSTFANEVQAITMPTAAAPDATPVVTDATKASRDFTQLSSVSDISQYQGAYSSSGLAQELQTFQQDVSNLATALSNS
jgi:hypothetical protein